MSNDLLQGTKERLIQLAGTTVADVVHAKDEAVALVNELKDNARKSARAGQTLVLSGIVAFIGILIACFSLAYLLNWLFPELPLWGCYGMVAVPLLVISVALMRHARQELNPFPSIQSKSTAIRQDMREAAHRVVEAGKDVAHESKEALQNTVNLERQVYKHPWVMTAGASAVGLAAGILMRETLASADTESPQSSEVAGPREDGHKGKRRGFSRLAGKLEAEIDMLETVAIGAMGTIVRDMIAQATSLAREGQACEVTGPLSTNLDATTPHNPALNGSHDPARR